MKLFKSKEKVLKRENTNQLSFHMCIPCFSTSFFMLSGLFRILEHFRIFPEVFRVLAFFKDVFRVLVHFRIFPEVFRVLAFIKDVFRVLVLFWACSVF